MKVGQSISMLGEYFLPKEVNLLLKSLQKETPPLEWPKVREQLVSELGEDLLGELEIDPDPHAAASIGQVSPGEDSYLRGASDVENSVSRCK